MAENAYVPTSGRMDRVHITVRWQYSDGQVKTRHYNEDGQAERMIDRLLANAHVLDVTKAIRPVGRTVVEQIKGNSIEEHRNRQRAEQERERLADNPAFRRVSADIQGKPWTPEADPA